jgi:hypothetical protein
MGSLGAQLALLSASALALAAAAPAVADDPPPPTPPSTPSIGQYVETVPTSNGGSVPGIGKRHSKPLSRTAATRLGAHPDAVSQRLQSIATSSAYGAPQRDLTPTSKTKSGRTSPEQNASRPDAENPVSAAVSAVSDSGDSHVFWLLAAVIVVTTTMVWATARRHRA